PAYPATLSAVYPPPHLPTTTSSSPPLHSALPISQTSPPALPATVAAPTRGPAAAPSALAPTPAARAGSTRPQSSSPGPPRRCCEDRKSTRLNQSPCNLVCRLLLEKKNKWQQRTQI